MNLIPAILVGVLGPLIGCIHSWFSRAYRLGSLYEGERGGAVKRRILLLLWHLPSLTWAMLALGVLVARLHGDGDIVVTVVAAVVFAVSGAGNLWATRRPFVGGILLLVTAALVLADRLVNS
jgi:hypothetical protein